MTCVPRAFWKHTFATTFFKHFQDCRLFSHHLASTLLDSGSWWVVEVGGLLGYHPYIRNKSTNFSKKIHVFFFMFFIFHLFHRHLKNIICRNSLRPLTLPIGHDRPFSTCDDSLPSGRFFVELHPEVGWSANLGWLPKPSSYLEIQSSGCNYGDRKSPKS